MKNLFTLIIVLFSITFCSAQKLKVSEKQGAVHKYKAPSIEDVIRLPDGKYLALSGRLNGVAMFNFLLADYRYEYFFLMYDEDLNVINEKRFELGIDQKNVELLKVVKYGYEHFVFFTFDNEKKGKKYLFYSGFDVDDLELTGNIAKVGELKMGGKMFSSPSFTVDVSNNGDFIVIFGKERKKFKSSKGKLFGRKTASTNSDVGNHTFSFTYWVLDKHLEIVNFKKKHSLKIKESSDKFYVRDYKIDDNGDIYILGKNMVIDNYTRAERRKKVKKVWKKFEKSAFVLQKINSDGESELFVTEKDLLLKDMVLLLEKGKVSLVGLSGEQVYNELVTTGIVMYTFKDGSLSVDKNESTKFSKKVIENVNDIKQYNNSLSDRRKKKNKKRKKRSKKKMTKEEKAYEDIKTKALLHVNYIAFAGIDDDGNIAVVLEERYLHIVETTTYDSKGNSRTTYTYYYHYDDLIFVKFDGDKVLQNYHNKEYTYVNYEPNTPMSVSLYKGTITVLAQDRIVRANKNLRDVKEYKIQSLEKKINIPKMKKALTTYRKTVNDNTLIIAKQRGRKIALFEVKIKN